MQITRYLNRAEAAEYVTARGLRITKNTLAKMATTGGGPVYRYFGHRTAYLEPDLESWINERLSSPMRSSSAV